MMRLLIKKLLKLKEISFILGLCFCMLFLTMIVSGNLKKNVDSFFCFGLTVINMLFIVIFVLFQFKYNLANKSKSSEKYLEKN